MTDAPDWVTLTDGEEVVWSGRPAIFPHLGGLLVGIVLGVAGGALASGVVGLPASLPRVVATVGGGVLVVAGVVLVLRELLAWHSVRYLVTSEEVYQKEGLVSRTVTNTRLDRVQNTTFVESTLGRVLSYGDVRVDTAGSGGTEVVFENVRHPDEVVASITEQLDAGRRE